jgi:hypothetical protein
MNCGTGSKIETAEIKLLRSVAGSTRKDQIRNTKIKEEVNIFNLNAKIIKSRATNGRQAGSDDET